MLKNIHPARALTYALGGILLCTAAWVAMFGPTQPIPMQYGLSGEVNRYGSRYELALVFAILAAVAAISSTLTGAQADQTEGYAQKPLRKGQYTTLVIIALVSAFIGWSSLGRSVDAGAYPMSLATGFLSVIMIMVGAVLGRMPPNAFIGVRTPWAFKSRLAWDKSNRLAGRLMFFIGFAGLIASPFIVQPFGMIALTVLILMAAGLSAYESWRVWRSDPEAQSF